MNKIIRSLPVLLLAMLGLLSKSAFAASVTVSVQQLPNGTAQQAICTVMQKDCVIPLTINAGTASQQSLNIQIKYMTNVLALLFLNSSGYLYTENPQDNFNHYLWEDKKLGDSQPKIYNVILVQPKVQTNSLIPGPLVAPKTSSDTPIANLQITVTPAP